MNAVRSPLLTVGRYYRLAHRLATRKTRFLDARSTFYRAYWSEAAAALGGHVEDLGDNYTKIRVGDRSTLTHFHRVNIDTYLSMALIGNKPIVQRILEQHGYPTPRFIEYELGELDRAEEFLDRSSGRCVVKPGSGSGGLGITTAVDSHRRLRSATMLAASSYTPRKLIVEEEVPGDSYRLLYLNGKLIDAVERRRPTVIGDGTNNVKELVRRENAARLNGGTSRSFTTLGVDLDCKFRLQDDGIDLRTVPGKGELVVVKNVANQNADRDNSSVFGDVHPWYDQLGGDLSRILGVNLVGLDVMAPDLTRPLHENGGAINELNIPPGLHYHELISNLEDKQDVGRQLLSFIFDGGSAVLSTPAEALTGR